MEDFAYRHERVAFAGPNYFMFASRKTGNLPAYYVNTRVYSFTLIDNSLPYRWRGRYNEDTDICLRALKDGYRTVLFNAFLCYKQTTMTMAGGNTDTVYVDGDNRLKFAESLKAQHPDVVTVTQKWGRYHHHVDYSPFKKNRLILKPGVVPTGAPNEYGMRLVRVNGTEENKGDSK